MKCVFEDKKPIPETLTWCRQHYVPVVEKYITMRTIWEYRWNGWSVLVVHGDDTLSVAYV